ncbi:unnamed protein product [Schistocephalus solidus]|uniref:Uncharacterized protein n=1 Tax=Schistocephalus solidus TaxID=70667 RepID=A0A183T911_SCHSO|nr:unnamed protein product [Schistocephalus solidus]
MKMSSRPYTAPTPKEPNHRSAPHGKITNPEALSRALWKYPSTISDTVINRNPEVDTNNDLGLTPSPLEIIRSVQQISSRKAPKTDAIPVEVYGRGGPG